MKHSSFKAIRTYGRSGIVLSLVLILLVLQACGNKAATSETPNAASTVPTASDAATTAASTPEATAAQITLPATLNYGYVGSTPFPTGIEGWGFTKGIIQEALKKYGVTEVKFIPFLTGPDLNEAIIGGRIDLGSSGDTPAVLAHSAGAKTRLIGYTNVSLSSIVIGRKDGGKTLEDLKGKKVAVVKGSLMYKFIVALLKEKGLTKDVTLVNINSIPDSEAALARGEVDAYVNTATSYSSYKLIKDGYPVLANGKDYSKLQGTSVIVATESYLSKAPGFIKAWKEAREIAYQDALAKPDAYYQFSADQTKTPVDIVKTLSPLESLAKTEIQAEGVERTTLTKDFLISQKLAQKDFNVQEWILK